MSSTVTVQILPCRAGLSDAWTFSPAEIVSITPSAIRLISTIPLQSGEQFLLRIKQPGGPGCAGTSIATYTVSASEPRTRDGVRIARLDARFEGFVANPRSFSAEQLAELLAAA